MDFSKPFFQYGGFGFLVSELFWFIEINIVISFFWGNFWTELPVKICSYGLFVYCRKFFQKYFKILFYSNKTNFSKLFFKTKFRGPSFSIFCCNIFHSKIYCRFDFEYTIYWMWQFLGILHNDEKCTIYYLFFKHTHLYRIFGLILLIRQRVLIKKIIEV